MSRLDASLREDALGALVSAGFADVRDAEPSPTSWTRLERRIRPRPERRYESLLRRLGRLVAPDARPAAQVLAWAAVPAVAVAALWMLVGLAGDAAATGDAALASSPGTHLGLAPVEWAYQPQHDGRWIGVARRGSIGLPHWRLSSAPPGMGGTASRSPVVSPPGIASQ